MIVYAYNDYRDWIQDYIERKKKLVKDFNFSRLAEKCEIQKTYLSKVLAKNTHLNTDQLFLICEACECTEEESYFLNLLLEKERCTVKKRKDYLLSQIKLLQRRQLSSESHLVVENVSASLPLMEEYFLDPYMQLVHVLLTIPSFEKNVTLISQKFNIQPERVQKILETLVRMKLVLIDRGVYKVISNSIHLPKESPVCKPYLINHRFIAIKEIQRQPFEDVYSFSANFASSVKSQEAIRKEFLKFLEKAQEISKSSKPEALFQINFDLFKH
jgi:uncharacterized protein (TIGR02147 family)